MRSTLPKGDFMRHVLLAVAGSTPQIVTETLWWLKNRADTGVDVQSVHVATTQAARVFVQGLCDSDGAITRLVREYGGTVPRLDVHVFDLLRSVLGAERADRGVDQPHAAAEGSQRGLDAHPGHRCDALDGELLRVVGEQRLRGGDDALAGGGGALVPDGAAVRPPRIHGEIIDMNHLFVSMAHT